MYQMTRILITGSEGLVGRAARRWLARHGHEVVGFDVALPENHPEFGDILDHRALTARCREADGIIHLAAVARVKHAEADPDRCWAVNVIGTENVIAAALAAPYRPWVLTTSSREVYGEPARTPVVEGDPVAPINVYGRSKAACEEVTLGGRNKGLGLAILRLANVYGSVRDHPDRVMPAFCRAAALGAPMRVEGVGYTFDFTHVLDVARGIERIVRLLEAGRDDLPPIHLASGRATKLEDLARMANAAGGGRSRIDQATNHAYNVSCFVGDPKRAGEILGWGAEVSIEAGVRQLVADFRVALDEAPGAGCPTGSPPS
jgi:nucleoside-diphosphate-sugar epimerase